MGAGDTDHRIRRRVIFHGHVQGVFFRATTAEHARLYGLVGWVRNLPDGSVELEAEGQPTQIEQLLDALQHHYRDQIMQRELDELPLRGDERRFEIRH